ncbi:MAG: TetR family transcriptional regulator [Luteitalea sp.]|nr:TetR family transcriptional regulator [Luteitalea sp.]
MAPRHGDSRARILKAASAEFAALGYAATRVDLIAHRARLNKGMVYYHFGSKLGLYRAIVLDMLSAIGGRLDELVVEPLAPAAKMRRVVEVYVEAAEERPHIPPIVLREVANKGRHFDRETVQALARLWRALGALIDQGVRTRAFAPVNPLLTHMGIVGPLMLFLAIEPARAQLLKTVKPSVTAPTRDELVAHLQNTVLAMLEAAPHAGVRRRGRHPR